MLVCTLLIVSFEKAGRRNTVTEMKIYLLMLLLPLMIQNILVLTKRSNKPATTIVGHLHLSWSPGQSQSPGEHLARPGLGSALARLH